MTSNSDEDATKSKKQGEKLVKKRCAWDKMNELLVGCEVKVES